MFIPSDYQTDIFDTYRQTNKNMVISAVPGSGKTTTLLKLLEMKPPHRRAVFLAFNKSISEELDQKSPRDVDVMTLHSLGCKAIYAWQKGKVKVNKSRCFSACFEFMNDWDIHKDKRGMYAYQLSRIMDLYRLHLCSNEQEAFELIAYHGLDSSMADVRRALWVLEWLEDRRYVDGKYEIDFADMIYLPVTNSQIRMRKYDDIFVDECQDLNAIQQKLISLLRKKTSRLVAVGDPNQSIYGFMGADIEAFNNLKNQPKTEVLPLSVSYRFGKNIAEEANRIWDTIEPYEQNPDGEVTGGSYNEAEAGDFVLCRNTQPLVELYFKYLDVMKKCYIKGNEIGENIIKLVDQYSGLDKASAIENLKADLTSVFEDLQSADIDTPVNHPRYAKLKEKIEIIEYIANRYDTMDQVKIAIQRMFTEEQDGIMLSTIHKSKGLETPNVFILRRELIPSQYAISQWQLVQEQNLLYVAITRAQERLVYINDF